LALLAQKCLIGSHDIGQSRSQIVKIVMSEQKRCSSEVQSNAR
jgi:hypothetical protein